MSDTSDWDDTPEGAPGWLAAAEPEEPTSPQRRGRRDIDGKGRHIFRQFRARVRQRAAAERAPCWICHGPINYALRHPDPLAWELDHEVPVVVAPERALDPTNAKSAHHRCNFLRGASGALDALDELGEVSDLGAVASRPPGWTPGDPEWNPELGCWPSEDWEAL